MSKCEQSNAVSDEMPAKRKATSVSGGINVSPKSKMKATKKRLRKEWTEFVEWLQRPFWGKLCLIVAIVFSICLCLPALRNCRYDYSSGGKPYTGESYDLFSQSDYTQAADAVLKGQVYLDINPDKKLLALEDPYNPKARDGVIYLWDHAFYEGYYYMYFGATPVFTVYLPFYFLTGQMPNPVTACLILGIFCCVAIPLAVFEWAKRFFPNVSPFLVGFASFVMVAVSGVFLHISYSHRYQIPILSALAMGFFFCYFVLRALRCKKKWSRRVLLAVAGVFYVATVASRPTAALLFLAPLPIVFFDILKPFKAKKAIKDLCALGIPVIIGAAILMWYNYARFGNPLDFGQKYQLTVADVSTYSLSGGLFGYAMIHYLFQQPTFDKDFPHITRSLVQMEYGRYIYVDRTLGVFAFPTTISALFAPAVLSFKKDPGKFIAYLFIPVCAVAVAFVDFCLAGVHIRYVFDILPMVTFLALLVWMEICGKLKGKYKVIAVCVGILLCAAALYLCYGLIMNHGGASEFQDPEPEYLFHKVIMKCDKFTVR